MPICCQQLFSNFFKFFRCPAAPLCGDSFVILALFFTYVNIYFQIFSKKYSKFSCLFDCSYCMTAESIEITRFYVYYEYSVNISSVIDSCNVSIMPTEFFSDGRRFIKSLYICSFFNFPLLCSRKSQRQKKFITLRSCIHYLSLAKALTRNYN